MKKNLLFAVFVLGILLSQIATAQSNLTHPGILVNLNDLNRMKTRKDYQPWKTGYDQVAAYKNYTMQGPLAYVGEQGVTSNNIYRSDAVAAYRLAVLWYVNNDVAAAEKAMQIIDAWATTHTGWGNTLTGLTRGDYGVYLITAADILRWTYPGWDTAKTNHCVTYFNTMYWDPNGPWTDPVNDNFGAGNQGISLLMGMMAEAIFVDDTAKYNYCVNAFRTNNCVSLTRNSLATGQNAETGRDQAHSMIEVVWMSEIAEMASKQGTDIYSDLSNRVLALNEHWSAYNLFYDVPYSTFGPCYANAYTSPNSTSRGIKFPNNSLEWVYREYYLNRGIAAPYSTQYRALCPVSSETFLYNAEPVPSVPAAPKIASASVGYNEVVLEWRHSSGAQTYNIKRATSSGGPYTTLASNYGGTIFVDKTVTNGTTYYYTVSATGMSEGPNATEVTVRPKNLSLADTDIGVVPVPGSSSNVNGNWTISGSGADISSANDREHFAYTQMIGDGSITARITSTEGGKTGLMMRENMSPGSRMAMVIFDGGSQIRLAYRLNPNDGNTYYQNASGTLTVPKWLRLTRSAGQFLGYYSEDGVNWINFGGIGIEMSTTVQVGLAMCSRTNSLRTSTFDNLTIKGIAPTPTGLTGTSISSSRNDLKWSRSEEADTYSLYRSTVSGGPYTLVKSGIVDTTYRDTGLIRSTYFYTLSATNMYGEGVTGTEISISPKADPPGGLTAAAGNGHVFVHWNTVDGATSYMVKRSTINGTGYTVIDSTTKPVYTDSAVVNDSTYYYVVSALGATGESGNSLQVSATPGSSKPSAFTWFGGVNSTWDFTTQNWKTNGVIAAFQNGGAAIFNDSSAKNWKISSSITNLAPAYVLVDNSVYADTLLNILTGPMELIKTGTKNLVLSGNNSYTGGTVINEGVVNATVNSALGTGMVTLNGGTLQLNNNANTFANNILVNGTAVVASGFTGGFRALTYNGTLSGGGIVRFVNNSGNNFPFNTTSGGNWSGFTGTLIYDEGNVNKNFSWNVTPTLDIRNGRVVLQNTLNAAGNTIFLNATSGKSYFGALSSSGVYTTRLAVAAGGTLSIGNLAEKSTFKGVISGAGSVEVTGGELTLTAANTYTGNTTINGGKLVLTGSLASGGTVTVNNSGTLSGTGTIAAATVVNQNAVITPGVNGPGKITFSGNFNPKAGAVLNMELGTTSSDQVALSGTYSAPVGSQVIVNISAAGVFDAGTYNLITGAFGINAADFAIGTTLNGYEYSLVVSGDTLQLVVLKEQQISFDALSEQKLGDPDVELGATASSGLPVTYSSSNPSVATIVNGKLRLVGGGTTIITAIQPGNSAYAAAHSVQQELHVFIPPVAKAKNLEVELDANGNASIIPSQIDNGSVSYNGALTLTLNKSIFGCPDVETSVNVILTATDEKGYQSTATALVTVLDHQKPVLTVPINQFFCYDNGGNYNVPVLEASDNCSIASVSYSISGATTRSGTGNNASGVFNAGVSTISWSVADVHGNVSTATTIITVNAPITLSIPDVYAMNPAVDAKNTIYIGYGPTSLSVSAQATGGTAPYSYQWNSGAATQSISVSAAGTYTVTITDAKGCTTTASITINTLDVRCGNNNDKVKVCHNGHEICVASAAVEEHLSHGDQLGGCTNEITSSILNTGRNAEELSIGKMVLYPNPATEVLNIRVEKLEAGATVQLYTVNGGLVLSQRLTNTTQAISLKGLAAGMYYAQVRNGNQQMSQKIIKQ